MVPALLVLSTVQPTATTTVFASGDGGFAQIRIPSLLQTKQGTLLAFAEGRGGTGTDQEKNKIVFRASGDDGKTWSKLVVLAGMDDAALNNPCAVQDSTSGRLVLMFQRYPAGLKEADGKLKPGTSGPDVVTSWLMTSGDNGKTWSKPRDITAQVKRPTLATTIASGPGVGIQLTKGRHKGRMIIPFNEGPFYKWQVYVAYSDDGGRRWQNGSNVPGAMVTAAGKTTSQVNEVQCVELDDGSVLMLARHWAGAACRKASVSNDGGETWSPVRDVPELTDPSCMGSVLRVEAAQDQGVLLYSGPDATDRSRGTLWTSRDGGKTWPEKRLIEPKGFAYSVLAPLSGGHVGCLYETDDYKRIVFTALTVP